MFCWIHQEGTQLLAKIADLLFSRENAHCSFSSVLGCFGTRSSFMFCFLGKSSLDINSYSTQMTSSSLSKGITQCRHLTAYASFIATISSFLLLCLLETPPIHCQLLWHLRLWKNYCVSRPTGIILVTDSRFLHLNVFKARVPAG